MFLLVLLAVVIAASFLLAKHSMADFQEKPDSSRDYAVFLVRRKRQLDLDFLSAIHRGYGGVVFSFEKLFKGEESATVLYAPRDIEKQFPNLELLELEDYAQKINLATALAWEEVKAKHSAGSSFSLKFLDQAKLSSGDQVYYQIVCQPSTIKQRSPGGLLFQLSMRVMVISPEPGKRLKIARQIDEQIKELKVLKKRQKTRSLTRIVKDYKDRMFTPKEVRNFVVNQEELLSLIT